MSDCGCDWDTGECQAPIGCKVITEIKRLRENLELMRADRDIWRKAYHAALDGYAALLDGERG